MNTMLRSSTTPNQTALAPSSLTTSGRPVVGGGGGVHRGIWIAGGLMALTIIALATTLVVRSNSSASDAAVPLAANLPATTGVTPNALTAAQPPVIVAQAPQAVQPAPAPVHTVRHTPVHNTSANSGSNGNTQVAANNSNATPAPAYNEAPRVAAAPVCTTCGVIDSYDSVQVAGQANGVGAVAGGVGGAVLGSKIAGRSNHTLGGVIGAIGGGLLGNAIEKHERTTTAYDVHVRMNDGSMRTVRQTTVPNVGSRVSVEGNSLHSAPAQGSTNYNNSSTPQPTGNGGSSFSPSGN